MIEEALGREIIRVETSDVDIMEEVRRFALFDYHRVSILILR
jgi:hypothetical protein